MLPACVCVCECECVLCLLQLFLLLLGALCALCSLLPTQPLSGFFAFQPIVLVNLIFAKKQDALTHSHTHTWPHSLPSNELWRHLAAFQVDNAIAGVARSLGGVGPSKWLVVAVGAIPQQKWQDFETMPHEESE